MISSMTGFGRAESITRERKIAVELKSVNHRYLDLGIKMPRKLNLFEGDIRSLAKQYMSRGKVDLYITYEDYTAGSAALKYNSELAGHYLECLRMISEEFGLENDIRTSTLSRYPEVFTMEDASLDEEQTWHVLEPVLKEAFQKFSEARNREGEHLKQDLLEKLDNLEKLVGQVQERYPAVVEAYREKITQKVRELLEDPKIDESRIAAEVVLFADKICNDEETVRLQSHIKSMRRILNEEEGIGRKLDFMAQEMNREANTILSKAGDLITADVGIELKTEIEKIREQIQNIE